MLTKIGFTLLWISVSIYAFFFAPPDNFPETFALIKNLSIGQWQGINGWVVALFNIMGVWPILYSCLLFFDGRGQKVPAWPFAAASFAVGAFAILPYLIFRESQPEFIGEKNRFFKLLESRITGFFLTLLTAALVVYGVINGNWFDFVHQWQTSRFIHVMTLDFILLSLLFPALLIDDIKRRNINNSLVFWTVSLIPLFGPLVYLCLRPPLPETLVSSNAQLQKQIITD